MNPVKFSQHDSLVGRKVRVLTADEVFSMKNDPTRARVTIDAYRGVLGKVGEIIFTRRLPWADKQRLDYNTLAIIFPDAKMVKIGDEERQQISYCGVNMLVLLDENEE